MCQTIVSTKGKRGNRILEAQTNYLITVLNFAFKVSADVYEAKEKNAVQVHPSSLFSVA
jgi:hypothetical protein